MKTKLAFALRRVALAGCATTPFAYVDGNRYYRTELYTYSVMVLGVNAPTPTPVLVEPVKVIRSGPPTPGALWGDGIVKARCEAVLRLLLQRGPRTKIAAFIPGVDCRALLLARTAEVERLPGGQAAAIRSSFRRGD